MSAMTSFQLASLFFPVDLQRPYLPKHEAVIPSLNRRMITQKREFGFIHHYKEKTEEHV